MSAFYYVGLLCSAYAAFKIFLYISKVSYQNKSYDV